MIKCKKSTIRLIENDILFINIAEKQEFCIDDYQELLFSSMKLTQNRRVFNLINLGNQTIPDSEAREACARNISRLNCVKAEAIVVHSLGQRIVARDILREKRKYMPVKLFTDLEKAKKWLEQIKSEQIN